MNKMTICLTVVLTAALLCVAACSGTPAVEPLAISDAEPAATEPAVEEGSVATPEPETTAAATEPAEEASDAQARKAFADALVTLLENRTLPDGTECEYDGSAELSANSFAVCDVDGDGREELVIVYVTASMAGQTQYVFGYDEGSQQLRLELSDFPALTFYSDGLVKADWSHNQGMAGAFWPYSVYRYDPSSDAYALTDMVDAWDKSFAAADAAGSPFPEDVDAEGAGFVYYIMENGVYETVAPVGQAAYDAWYASVLGQATELPVAYTPLTAEAAAAIG